MGLDWLVSFCHCYGGQGAKLRQLDLNRTMHFHKCFHQMKIYEWMIMPSYLNRYTAGVTDVASRPTFVGKAENDIPLFYERL